MKQNTPKNAEIDQEGGTGNWFVMCSACYSPAFIFAGEEKPNINVPVEDQDGISAGKHRYRKGKICGTCGFKIRSDERGRFFPEEVYQVDSWCRAKARPITAYGFKARKTQEAEGFFVKNERGQPIPSRETIARFYAKETKFKAFAT